jgi:DNA invertase Pin-like site-specific DNA recombinase
VREHLNVVEWLEEKETAPKRGRPVFDQIIWKLKHRKADGLIVHKVDRSARNLKDWADLGRL